MSSDATKNTALITGASSGIGFELAQLLADKDFNLVLVARSKSKLENLKHKILQKNSVSVKILNLDLNLKETPPKIFDILKQELVSITHLINNAGVGDLSRFDQSIWEKNESMIDLNIKSLTHLCYLFLPELKKQKSATILNVSSTAAFLPGPNMAVYYATKAYVQSFSEALAEELTNTSVKIITLCPGPTQSGFQDAASISLKNPLFQNVPSSLEVAQYTVELIENGSRIGIHGFKNKAMVFFLRFMPRRLTTKIVSKIQNTRFK